MARLASFYISLLLLLPVSLSSFQASDLQNEGCHGRMLTTVEQVEGLQREQCSIIHGPLIVQYLSQSRNKTLGRPSLDSVKEITGFLLVQRLDNHYTDLSQLLPRLRTVRGHQLLAEGQWAFVVRDNHHLRKLGLPSVCVLNGRVQLSGNANLCDSLMDSSCNLEVRSSQCFRYSDNHKLFSSTGNCSYGQIGNMSQSLFDLQSNCSTHSLYLATGYRNNYSCKDVRMAVLRTTQLDGREYIEPKLDFVPTFAHNNQCVVECPSNYIADNWNAKCQPCPREQFCRVCKAPEEIVTDYHQVQYLENCTVLNGNLKLSVKLSGIQEYYFHKYLEAVWKITGYLLVFYSSGLRTLSFLDNLVEIGGDHLWKNRYGLALFGNWDLSYLWKGVNKMADLALGTYAYVQFNPSLCKDELNDLKSKFNMTEGNVGNSLTGTCGVNLLLNVSEVTADSVVIEWKSSDSNSSGHSNVTGYLLYYIRLEDLAAESAHQYEKEQISNWIKLQTYVDFSSWNVIDLDGDKRSVTITDLFSRTKYLVHIQSYMVADFSKGPNTELSNVGSFETMEGFPSEPRHLTAVSYPSQSNATSNLTLTWNSPYQRNNTVINYEVELWTLEWYFQSCRLDTIGGHCSDLNLYKDNNSQCFHYTATNGSNSPLFEQLARFYFKNDSDDCFGNCTSYKVNSTSAIFSMLYPFSAYKVRVRAETNEGFGPWSRNVIAYTSRNYDNVDVIEATVAELDAKMVSIMWNKPPTGNPHALHVYCLEFRWKFKDGLRWVTPNNSLISVSRGDSMSGGLRLTSVDQQSDLHLTLQVAMQPEIDTEVTCTVTALRPFPWADHCLPPPVSNITFTMVARKFTMVARKFTMVARKSRLLWYVVGAVVFLAIIVVVVACFVKRMKKKSNQVMTLASSDFIAGDGYVVDEWEVDRCDVIVKEALGEGAFGVVYAGSLHKDNRIIKVAIKTLMTGASYMDRVSFLKEASVMKKFNSQHVIRLLGIVSQGDPVLVVMELMAYGDLKHYLRSLRPQGASLDVYNIDPMPLTEDELLQMAAQIAAGMAYLADMKYIHRDLAARNCMVAEDKTIKLGDFGLARGLYSEDYYRKCGKGPMPIRWMAPEALRDGVFCQASDVWSYGVVLWEIVTVGAQPYFSMTNEDVLGFVVAGGRMNVSALNRAPPVLVKLMGLCWQYSSSSRPTFVEILAELPAVDNTVL